MFVPTSSEQDLVQTDKDPRLIPKADRKKIHEYLFREGVLVAQKDCNAPKHRVLDTRNLYVGSEDRVNPVAREPIR